MSKIDEERSRRFRELVKTAEANQHALAKAIGYSDQHLSDVVTGKAPVTERLAAKVAGVLGSDFKWIMYGIRQEEPEPQINEAYGRCRIPVVTLAAADPLSTISWEPLEPPEWIEIPRGAKAVEVRGDSMAPVILNGQRPIYDPETPPQDGDLAFVVMWDGRHFIKRWWKQADGSILLESIGARDPRVPKRPDPDLVVKEGEVKEAYQIIMTDYRGRKR
jgi:transcriptional regulator with XRE-family HTH domain